MGRLYIIFPLPVAIIFVVSLREGAIALPINVGPTTVKLPVICADPVKGRPPVPVKSLPSPENDPENDPVL